MVNSLENRIKHLEERANRSGGDGVNCVLVMLDDSISREEKDKAFDEYYKEHPEDCHPIGIVTLELRRDEQRGEVKVEKLKRFKEDD